MVAPRAAPQAKKSWQQIQTLLASIRPYEVLIHYAHVFAKNVHSA